MHYVETVSRRTSRGIKVHAATCRHAGEVISTHRTLVSALLYADASVADCAVTAAWDLYQPLTGTDREQVLTAAKAALDAAKAAS